jgi:hypothetical protein
MPYRVWQKIAAFSAGRRVRGCAVATRHEAGTGRSTGDWVVVLPGKIGNNTVWKRSELQVSQK